MDGHRHRRPLVEHRHDHDRSGARQAAHRPLPASVRPRGAHRAQLPGRVGGVVDRTQRLVGPLDRHGAHRPGSRGHRVADARRVQHRRQRRDLRGAQAREAHHRHARCRTRDEAVGPPPGGLDADRAGGDRHAHGGDARRHGHRGADQGLLGCGQDRDGQQAQGRRGRLPAGRLRGHVRGVRTGRIPAAVGDRGARRADARVLRRQGGGADLRRGHAVRAPPAPGAAPRVGARGRGAAARRPGDQGPRRRAAASLDDRSPTDDRSTPDDSPRRPPHYASGVSVATRTPVGTCAVRLDRLLGDVEVLDLRGDATVEVSAVSYDSRAVRPGALFCCVRGERTDGHQYARAATSAGAVALLCERALALDVTQVVVADVRTAMAHAAAAFHGHPSRQLEVVGVTGTNGKTTTTHLLQAVLEADGRRTGLIGTLSGARTTPEAPDLQAQLAQLRDDDYRAVAMEVSSHALAQHRADATSFAVAVFTNLSQDHLDYHHTMEAYFQAKARLFEAGRTAAAVVNTDDPHGRILFDAAVVPTRGYSMADAVDLDVGPRGTRFRWEGEPVQLRLGGALNVINALAAAAAARELGVGAPAVAAGLSSLASVPGRFEIVEAGQPFTVVVDYAHTP